MFIEGDTKDSIGFDVIKFYKSSGTNEEIIFRLEHEQEVIFPISEKCVVSRRYLTCEEFEELMMNQGK